jgi:DNA-binding NtrC family response regulator
LTVEGSTVHVRDLNSRNGTRVNGHPVAEATLKLGDELSLGDISLMLTTRAFVPSGLHRAPTNGDTASAMRLPPQSVEEPHAFLHTLGEMDLRHLYRMSREFGLLGSMAEVLALAQEAMESRLAARRGWVVLGANRENLEVVSWFGVRTPEHQKDVPWSLVRRVFKHRQSETRSLKKQAGTVIAAPIVLHDAALGVMLCVTDGDHPPSCDEAFAAGLGYTIAPHLELQEDRRRLEADLVRQQGAGDAGEAIIGSGEAIKRALYLARLVARSDQSILLIGETGTGKELLARLIHRHSDRAQGPFVAVNCAAIPRELFESEVFGHVKGAFTGAVSDKIGLMEESDGGTLFLDEIGDLSPEHQARILRAVESGVIRRVGAREETTASFRVVAATNKILLEEVRAGNFREDLYHRLRGFEVRLPPLRERTDDIPELARHFLNDAQADGTAPACTLAPAALKKLQAYPWTGNVRELRQCLRTAAILAQGGAIDAAILDTLLPPPATDTTLLRSLADVEANHIRNALKACGGSITRAAEYLGIARSTLYEKLATHGIER